MYLALYGRTNSQLTSAHAKIMCLGQIRLLEAIITSLQTFDYDCRTSNHNRDRCVLCGLGLGD